MKSSQLNNSHDKALRSLVKTLTYRVVIIISVFWVAFMVTGRADFAAGFSLISNAINTVLYFIHERIWSRINWGRIK